MWLFLVRRTVLNLDVMADDFFLLIGTKNVFFYTFVIDFYRKFTVEVLNWRDRLGHRRGQSVKFNWRLMLWKLRGHYCNGGGDGRNRYIQPGWTHLLWRKLIYVPAREQLVPKGFYLRFSNWRLYEDSRPDLNRARIYCLPWYIELSDCVNGVPHN